MAAVLPLLMFQMQLAANISSIMNTTVDPCVDFYKFACGNYENVASIPKGRTLMNRFMEADNAIRNDLRALLEEPDRPDDPSSTLLIKRFYRSCMNIEKLDSLGLDPLKSLLDKYGGWPVVVGNKWNSTSYDWMKTNALITVIGTFDNLLKFTIEPDYKNGTRKVLKINQPDLFFGDPEFYLKAKHQARRDAYTKFRMNTAKILGAETRASLIMHELEQVMDLEIALANISEPSNKRDATSVYHPLTIGNLKKQYPWVGFESWFKTVAEAGLNLTDSDEVDLNGQWYLERLENVYSKYPKRLFANLQIWNLVEEYVRLLAPSLLDYLLEFDAVQTGVTQFPPRWEVCVGMMNRFMKTPVGAAYVKKYFNATTKSEVDDMVMKLRNALSDTLNGSYWMDDESKVLAQAKLSKLAQNVAYPDPEIFDETWVMRDFVKVNISEDSYLENVASVRASAYDRAIREYRGPINRNEWTSVIAKADYTYSLDNNRLVLTAGILRLPMYDSQAPDYFNFGLIGSLIGGLLAYGFDITGQQYDGDGNTVNWWTNKTNTDFQRNPAGCLVNQYGNITDTLTGIRLNGKRTFSANFADNTAVQLAYKAFRAARQNPSINSEDRNKILPDFGNYTADQLFFLSRAQAYCTLIHYPSQEYLLTNGRTSPANIRINEAFRNSDEFAAAFKCLSGSPMNPVDKCKVW